MAVPQPMNRRGTFDLFLSQLEDDLRKDREAGRPIRSLWQFSEVVRQSYRCASESASSCAPEQVTKVIKCDHGGYLSTMPDGLIKVDSQNPYGDWEKFSIVSLEDDKVAIRSDHGRYVATREDGSVCADAESPEAASARFQLVEHGSGKTSFATSEGKYLIAMSDGFLRADSTNPDGTWEQFEIDTLEKDMILNRKELFEFLDQLSRDGKKFTSLTYAVNEWSMGGVVRLKHHSIILTEGDHHLKFDFGRWGIGWSLSHFFPVLPKGTCKQDRFDIQADPEVIKRYCLDVKEFSWLTNNCSSFSEGLMQELKVSEPSSLLDMWPTWSRCVAGVKVPTRRPPQTAAADAPPAAPEPPPVTHTVRCEHGTFLVALPDGLVKTDSRSSSGDWERFVVVEAGGDKVALRSHHGRYLSARPDGSAKAVVTSLDEDSARFRPLPHPSGRVLFETYEGKYLVALPDGAMRADSTNPQGTWEQFEIANLDLEKALTSEQAEVGELEVIHDIDELAQSLPDVPESSRSHQAEQPDNIHNIDELAQSLPDVPEFSRSKDGHGSKPAFSFESQTSVADSTPSSESRHMHLGPVCIVNDVIGEEDGITEVLLVEPTPICRFDYFETSKKRSLMHDSGSGNAQIISL